MEAYADELELKEMVIKKLHEAQKREMEMMLPEETNLEKFFVDLERVQYQTKTVTRITPGPVIPESYGEW